MMSEVNAILPGCFSFKPVAYFIFIEKYIDWKRTVMAAAIVSNSLLNRECASK